MPKHCLRSFSGKDNPADVVRAREAPAGAGTQAASAHGSRDAVDRKIAIRLCEPASKWLPGSPVDDPRISDQQVRHVADHVIGMIQEDIVNRHYFAGKEYQEHAN
jgi:hypothetical protein